MRVACLQPSVAGVDAGPAWLHVIAECRRHRVDLLVTPEFAVGGLPHTTGAAVAREATARELGRYIPPPSSGLTIDGTPRPRG